MILSKHAFIKIAPNNHAYWMALGYEVGKTGGRAGINGVRRIKVKVKDLVPGSGVHVACRCAQCEKKFVQRFYRDHNLCGKCRQAAGREKPRVLSIDPRMPSKEELLAFVEGGRGAKTAIAKQYGTTTMVVKGWLQKSGIDFSQSLKHKAIPADFIEYFTENNPTKIELAERYDVNLALIDRWFERLDLTFKGVTTKIEMPDLQEMIELNQTLDADKLAEYYNVRVGLLRIWFRRHKISLKKFGNYGTSEEENEFVDFLDELLPGFIRNRKSILKDGRMELDAYHPELKIAFEYDGAYWHSLMNSTVHRSKWDQCKERGISLYRVHSFEWNYKKTIVKSMVKARLGLCDEKIYARNLESKKINGDLANYFHDKNHIHGAGISSVNFGLYDGVQLISVMSFAKSRYPGGYEWEISRFSSRINCLVIGGAGKLFAAFCREYDPKSVLTFSDLRWGTGNVYESIGFKKVKCGTPTYWYYHDDFPEKRFYRQAFQKGKLSSKLKIFNSTLTEDENMRNNKFWKYWDCGSNHFVWKKEK